MKGDHSADRIMIGTKFFEPPKGHQSDTGSQIELIDGHTKKRVLCMEGRKHTATDPWFKKFTVLLETPAGPRPCNIVKVPHAHGWLVGIAGEFRSLLDLLISQYCIISRHRRSWLKSKKIKSRPIGSNQLSTQSWCVVL